SGELPDEDELVADAIGLPDERMQVRTLLYNNAPVDRALLERIAQAQGIDVEGLARFEGQPLRSFYADGVCGGVLLRLGSQGPRSREPQTQVPMAFQSTLAGVMLAAELVIDATGLRENARFP